MTQSRSQRIVTEQSLIDGPASEVIGFRTVYAINPLDPSYGAAGDGITDDRSALTSALAAGAAFGVAVDLRGLTYKALDTVTVPAGATLKNGFIHCTGTGKTILDITGNNVTLENISVLGRHGTATASANELGIVAHGASAAAPITNLTIRNCSVELVGQNAIDLKWVTGFRIIGCSLGDLGYSGVAVLSGINGWILDNDIENVLAGFSSNGYGIILSRNPSSDLTADPRSANIRVRGNYVKSVPWNGIDTHAGQDLTISGNHVYNCKFGIAIGSCPVSGVATFAPLNVSVVDNYVDSLVNDGSKDTGIIFTGATGASSSVAAVEYATGKIVGNTVRRHGSESNNNQGAIMFRNTQGLVVGNNVIDQPSPHGICAYYDNRDTVIASNAITDPWSNTAAVGVATAIAARADNNTGVVFGNTLRNAGAKSAATYGFGGTGTRGVSQLSGSGNDWTVTGNDFGAAATPISGTGATMRMPAGSAALPGLAFAEDTDCGFYRIAANQMGLAVNGLGQLNFIDGAVIIIKTNYSVSCANGFQLGGASSHKLGFWGATPAVRPTALTATVAAAPAGGTGTAAGGWDTAANRDAAIATINNLKTRVDELETKFRTIGLLT